MYYGDLVSNTLNNHLWHRIFRLFLAAAQSQTPRRRPRMRLWYITRSPQPNLSAILSKSLATISKIVFSTACSAKTSCPVNHKDVLSKTAEYESPVPGAPKKNMRRSSQVPEKRQSAAIAACRRSARSTIVAFLGNQPAARP